MKAPRSPQNGADPPSGSRLENPVVHFTSATANKIIVPDPDEIRPARPIARSEIEEVLTWHRELCEPLRMFFNRAVRIGCKLRAWHDLIPHGSWLKWCKANLPEITERTIQNYIALWDNHEWLEKRLSNTKPVSDLEEHPTIKEALTLIAEERKAKAKPASRKITVTVETRPLLATPPVMGPVHEFAIPLSVPRNGPEPIEELKPEAQPPPRKIGVAITTETIPLSPAKASEPKNEGEKPLTAQQAIEVWLNFLGCLPEQQRPSVARAAFAWTNKNGDLLDGIYRKYGQTKVVFAEFL